MNCDQVRTSIVAYLKDELHADERKRLEEHLARCPMCRHELEGARRVLIWTQAASDEPVSRAIEQIINDAVDAHASDIHLEPSSDNSLAVRYRVDGVLHEAVRIDSGQRYGVLTRLKLMAEIPIPETATPQHGRSTWLVGDRRYDLRVSSMPYILGEGIVVKLLDQTSALIGLDKLGMCHDHMAAVASLLRQPTGLILIAGPTGSGKTTTRYSLLCEVRSPQIKLASVENPVEYLLAGVNQCQLNPAEGLTYPRALRALLRQDPDVISVGDVRDLETAELCVEAALTGHLVISEIHADSAAAGLRRLVDLGVARYVVAATLIGVVAQKLVRTICPSCKEETKVDPADPVIRHIGISPHDLANHRICRGKGCDACRRTGYYGRTGLFEVLSIDRKLAAKIADGADAEELVQAAAEEGFRTMREDGRQKVLGEVTTPEEVLRLLM